MAYRTLRIPGFKAPGQSERGAIELYRLVHEDVNACPRRILVIGGMLRVYQEYPVSITLGKVWGRRERGQISLLRDIQVYPRASYRAFRRV